MVRPKLYTFPGRETMMEPNPRCVMSSALMNHLVGWARLRPVTLAISLTIFVESSQVLRLPIIEGMPWMT